MRFALTLRLLPLAGFVVLLVLVVTRWGPLRTLDLDVARTVHDPARATLWKVVSEVGQPATWQVLAVITALTLAFRKRRQVTTAIWVALTVLLAGPLSNLVKWLVDRDRPTVVQALSRAAGSSFPSGHATSSIVGVIVLVTVWTAVPRAIAIPVGTLVVAAIGYSRLALGVHYLSDVLAGWLLGASWVIATRTVLIRTVERRAPGSGSPDRPRRRPSG